MAKMTYDDVVRELRNEIAYRRAHINRPSKSNPDGKRMSDAEFKKLARPVIQRANARIAVANRKKTRAAEFAYESGPMRRIREPGDAYYLPTGKHNLKGATDDAGGLELTRRIANAIGFNELKTTTPSGAAEQYSTAKKELRRALKAGVIQQTVTDQDYQVYATAGAFQGAAITLAKELRRHQFTSKAELEAARATLKARDAEINRNYKAAMEYFDNLTPAEVGDMFEEYRRYLDYIKAEGGDEWADYEANNQNYTPGKIFAKVFADNIKVIKSGGKVTGWHVDWVTAIQAKNAAKIRNAYQQQVDDEASRMLADIEAGRIGRATKFIRR